MVFVSTAECYRTEQWPLAAKHLTSVVVSYSITSVGLGADPGFLAVSPQVT